MVGCCLVTDAVQILHDVFGYPEFRGQQADIIATVAGGQHALVLMPTGAGKSLCYQIPALMRQGVAVVVSPLVALMQDQVAALINNGIAAACVYSGTASGEIRRIADEVADGHLKLLYVAPERLVMPSFLQFLHHSEVGLFAIDEAHCVSQWGHDFRPEYQQLGILAEQFPQVPRIALTATADAATRADIQFYLQLTEAAVFTSSFDRPNIDYQVVEKNNGKKQLLEFIRTQMPGQNGIIYCLSRKKVEDVAAFLCEQGLTAIPYHAGLEWAVRHRHQRRFTQEDGIIVVATVAFGMGIDKPDVRFVAHLDMPASIEHFYQESGRAGRDGLPAVSWLCYGLNDWVLLRDRIQQAERDEQQKQIDVQKLDAMLAFCETVDCRRQMLLRYFGENSQPCGHCDNCLTPPARFDGTILVQQLLSCVYRVGQRFAAGHVIDVLRGKETDWVCRYQHQQLSTFGIGQKLSAKEWRTVTRQCVAAGFLTVGAANQALQLTEAARAVLKSQQQVWLRPLKYAREERRRSSHQDVWLRTEREERLWQALRQWRKNRASKDNVPAFAIFADRTLQDLVRHPPRQQADLIHIYGLGERKIERFGTEIMDICRQWLAVSS